MRILRRIFENVYFFVSAIFNAGIKLKYVLLLCIAIGAGIYSYTRYSLIKAVGGQDDYDEAMRYIEIKDLVDENFIDPVDRKSMGDSAAAAMVSGLGDSWSYYMSADEYRAYQMSSVGEYSDIGMSIMKETTSGGFQVLSVTPGSPAAVAGVGVGMVITAVDQQSLAGYSEDEARTLIRSKMNGVFYLQMGNGDYTLQVDCTGISNSSVNYRMEKTEAGYVQIRNFEAGSGEAAVDAIESLLSQGAVGLVIDLRENPGGLTAELETFLDYLLPKGRLFSEVGKSGETVDYQSDGVCIQLPMCVLVNAGTFREAEVCAAVLQEYGWASIMGEPTTGNTRTQDTLPLADGSAIRLSTGSYLTPNGIDISQRGGVVPEYIVYNSDVSATGTTEGTTGGEDGTASVSDDTQLMQALSFLSRNQAY